MIVGLILMVAGIKGTHKDLFAVLKDDFTGSGNFFVWVLACIIVVSVGYIEKVRPVSDAFLTLIILVIILYNGQHGLFQNFVDQIRDGTRGK